MQKLRKTSTDDEMGTFEITIQIPALEYVSPHIKEGLNSCVRLYNPNIMPLAHECILSFYLGGGNSSVRE